jgi:hypothetical protein
LAHALPMKLPADCFFHGEMARYEFRAFAVHPSLGWAIQVNPEFSDTLRIK